MTLQYTRRKLSRVLGPRVGIEERHPQGNGRPVLGRFGWSEREWVPDGDEVPFVYGREGVVVV